MEEKKLKDICEFIVDCPHSTAKDEGSGYPLIRTPNVGKGRLILQGVHRVNEKVYKTRIERATPSAGDIILAREAPVGNAAIIMPGQKVCLGQRVVLLRAKSEIVNPMFLVYYLLSNEVQHKLKNNANGAVVAHLNMDEIRNLALTLPSIVTQDKIAEILSSIDDKIEVNRRINDNFVIEAFFEIMLIWMVTTPINDNLEQQAQALFKSWFVDFEPFRNQPFVESELGMIPQGWRIGSLFDVAVIFDKQRKPLSGKERENMKRLYPYYGATSCMDYVDNYLFDGIYTLIGEDGSVAREDGLPYMQYVWGKFWVNNHAHILQGKNCFSTEMIHVFLSITNIQHLVTGAVQAKLSQANMQKILLAIPPVGVLNQIRPIIGSMYETKREKEDESRRLASLRDTLLPRLMSGELKINEVEVL